MDHGILLDVLSSRFGVTNRVFELFQFYLTGRTQVFCTGSDYSKVTLIACRVPGFGRKINNTMQLKKVDIALKIGSVVINPSNSVRDLGVLLDNELTMRPHINKIISACFYRLRRLQQLRRLLDRTMMQRLVSASVISRLDYCNSTLVGLTACTLEPLQRVLHAAVRFVAGLGRRDHVRESMKDLHWLPIAHRIKFKLCILMHEEIFGPSYIRDPLVPVSEMQGRT